MDHNLEASGSLSGYAITRIFICRDDMYLYWRMDFAGTSPYWRRPSTDYGQIIARMIVPWEVNKHFDADVVFSNVGEIWDTRGSYDDQGTDQQDYFRDASNFESSQSMLVSRIPLKGLSRYFSGKKEVRFLLGSPTDHWHRDGGSALTPIRYIDFS